MAREGLLGHPKFRRLCRLIKQPVPYTLGLLECLWLTGYNCGDPYLGREAADVEGAAQWPGKPGLLFSALIDPGAAFVEPSPLPERPGWQIHDLLDHAPDMVWKRARREIARRCHVTLKDAKAEVLAWIRENPRWIMGISESAGNPPGIRKGNNGIHISPGEGVTPAPAPAPAPYPLPPPPGVRAASATPDATTPLPAGRGEEEKQLEQPPDPGPDDNPAATIITNLSRSKKMVREEPDLTARRDELERQKRIILGKGPDPSSINTALLGLVAEKGSRK